jgi:hypothetical protein
MNVEKIYLLQDEILQLLGKNNIQFVFSGSTPLARAFYSHRYSFDLQFFSEKGILDKEILENIKKEIETNFLVLKTENGIKYRFPETTEFFDITVAYKEDNEGENPVKVQFLQDLFNGIFETIKLDFGIKMEEMNGIYFRKLVDFFNEPGNVEHIVDIIVMDEEYSVEDFYGEFIEIMKKKGFKVENDLLNKNLKIFKESLEKDIIEIDKKLKFLGSIIDVQHIKRWINTKVK